MFALYKGTYPAILCPITGEFVVIFRDNAMGFSRCMAILRDVREEVAEVLAMAEAIS